MENLLMNPFVLVFFSQLIILLLIGGFLKLKRRNKFC